MTPSVAYVLYSFRLCDALGKDSRGSGRGIIEVISGYITGCTEENHESLSKKSWCVSTTTENISCLPANTTLFLAVLGPYVSTHVCHLQVRFYVKIYAKYMIE
jgi:hypothetical protein